MDTRTVLFRLVRILVVSRLFICSVSRPVERAGTVPAKIHTRLQVHPRQVSTEVPTSSLPTATPTNHLLPHPHVQKPATSLDAPKPTSGATPGGVYNADSVLVLQHAVKTHNPPVMGMTYRRLMADNGQSNPHLDGGDIGIIVFFSIFFCCMLLGCCLCDSARQQSREEHNAMKQAPVAQLNAQGRGGPQPTAVRHNSYASSDGGPSTPVRGGSHSVLARDSYASSGGGHDHGGGHHNGHNDHGDWGAGATTGCGAGHGGWGAGECVSGHGGGGDCGGGGDGGGGE